MVSLAIASVSFCCSFWSFFLSLLVILLTPSMFVIVSDLIVSHSFGAILLGFAIIGTGGP